MYQPSDEPACGPAAIKHALAILGKRASFTKLREMCKVTRNGTSTHEMIRAVHRLGLPALLVKSATLRHIQSALRYSPNKMRAVMVSYLYELDENEQPHPESGHWATVSSFLASKSRIVLFDSCSGRKKSYQWSEFRDRWTDYDYQRRRLRARGRRFQLIRRWQPQLLLIVAKRADDLPHFQIPTARVFLPGQGQTSI